MHAVPILIVSVLSISIASMIIFIRKFTNDERMALIDKGADPKLFKGTGGNVAMKFGLLLIGAGIGLLIGNFLANVSGIEEEVAYFSMLFIFGGLGLFSSHLLEKRDQDKD
ncbi:MAG: hypothetical protein NXI20_02270 [bacterium]|nr:hypothetical protein [bacterium]